MKNDESPEASFETDDVEILKCERAFDGYFAIDRYTLRHRKFEGGWTEPMTRELFERGHVVAGLPYDPVRDEVVLIEQFRIGAFSAQQTPWYPKGESPWMVEVVAGVIDEGEPPDQVIDRECLEETGLPALDRINIGHYMASPGGTSETVYTYLMRVDANGAGGVQGLEHEGENIRVFTLPAETAFQWMDAGKIQNAATLICLQWFRLNHENLRATWRAKG